MILKELLSPTISRIVLKTSCYNSMSTCSNVSAGHIYACRQIHWMIIKMYEITMETVFIFIN
jgi:hypothetical protein